MNALENTTIEEPPNYEEFSSNPAAPSKIGEKTPDPVILKQEMKKTCDEPSKKDANPKNVQNYGLNVVPLPYYYPSNANNPKLLTLHDNKDNNIILDFSQNKTVPDSGIPNKRYADEEGLMHDSFFQSSTPANDQEKEPDKQPVEIKPLDINRKKKIFSQDAASPNSIFYASPSSAKRQKKTNSLRIDHNFRRQYPQNSVGNAFRTIVLLFFLEFSCNLFLNTQFCIFQGPFLKTYAAYIQNYSRALETLRAVRKDTGIESFLRVFSFFVFIFSDFFSKIFENLRNLLNPKSHDKWTSLHFWFFLSKGFRDTSFS